MHLNDPICLNFQAIWKVKYLFYFGFSVLCFFMQLEYEHLSSQARDSVLLFYVWNGQFHNFKSEWGEGKKSKMQKLHEKQ